MLGLRGNAEPNHILSISVSPYILISLVAYVRLRAGPPVSLDESFRNETVQNVENPKSIKAIPFRFEIIISKPRDTHYLQATLISK